jgi:hypothetical protein
MTEMHSHLEAILAIRRLGSRADTRIVLERITYA